MAMMETYVSTMFVVLLGMLLLFLWLRRKAAPERKYNMSDEATKEIEAVLGDYRRVLAVHTEAVKDIGLLPESKEVIKKYLQIAIGLARLNREASAGLLEDYYSLAHFQDVDGIPTLPAATTAWPEGPAEEIRQRHEEMVVQETANLEKELEAFLKRKKLF
jgi:hypothetical protein